jgi:hypothetical protein
MRFICVLLLAVAAASGQTGGRVEYVGGTMEELRTGAGGLLHTANGQTLLVRIGKRETEVPYDRINLVEYGQNASRRIVMAVIVNPLFLLAKSRRHYLTIGFRDSDDRQQAMVLRVDKKKVRAVLVSLEARTGLRVQYQDDEARKAGKG